mgnify:FL=1
MNIENKKWLIGASGGPDSMALVKICLDKKINFAIAHVNYHHRKEAEEEEEYITSFAKKHHIPIYVLNGQFTYSGNFEAEARRYRYNFFKEIVEKDNYDGVLVAHHKDDLLETYLMQKEKHLIPETYGLAEEIDYEGIRVCRPLLSYTKKDLENICKDADIKYYIDCTNNDITLARNYIRHEILAKMSEEEKEDLLKEIQDKNKHMDMIREKVEKLIVYDKVSLQEYRLLNDEERITLVHVFLKPYYRKDQGMSYAYKKEIDSILLKQDDFIIPFGIYEVVQDEGYFFVIKKPKAYSYIMNSSEDIITGIYFKIADIGKKSESITVDENEYPLTIRNAEAKDAIKMRFGTKKVSRFFIDRHIPLYKRETYPVVVNNRGEVILVPELGPDVKHYSIKPDFYVIELKDIKKEK